MMHYALGFQSQTTELNLTKMSGFFLFVLFVFFFLKWMTDEHSRQDVIHLGMLFTFPFDTSLFFPNKAEWK